MSSVPPNPNQKPPSYSLLGILLVIRLAYRIQSLIAPLLHSNNPSSTRIPPVDGSSSLSLDATTHGGGEIDKNTYIDSTTISSLVPRSLVTAAASEGEDGKDFWGDRTVLDVDSLPSDVRASRRCALCLEERTASAVTECGHVFCWTCVVGWAREKVCWLTSCYLNVSLKLSQSGRMPVMQTVTSCLEVDTTVQYVSAQRGHVFST